MGLDSIPHTYPCRTHGTAIMSIEEDGQESIDCSATIAAVQCPYLNANPPDGSVIGMLGTVCWARGVHYAHYLETYTPIDVNVLWGPLSADQCEDLATQIDTAMTAETFTDLVRNGAEQKVRKDAAERAAYEERTGTSWPIGDDSGPMTVDQAAADIITALTYFAWYLRWAARECDGLDAWW